MFNGAQAFHPWSFATLELSVTSGVPPRYVRNALVHAGTASLISRGNTRRLTSAQSNNEKVARSFAAGRFGETT